MRLLNVRVDDELETLIDSAVAVSDSPNRSAWCREALQAGAYKELTAAERREPPIAPVDRRHQGQRLPSGCQHPPQARWIGVTVETCTVCGATVRSRL